MTGLIISLLIFCLAFPAAAFVEKLNPNMTDGLHGGIPCHAMGAILRFHIAPGGPVPAVVSSIIQREWVPGGWSAQDTDDNSNMIGILNAATQAEKEVFVGRLEDFCMLWELGVDEVDSPAEYRLRLGLPAAP